MTDMTNQQVDDLAAALSRLDRTSGNLVDTMSRRRDIEKKMGREMERSVRATVGAITDLATSAEDAGHWFRNFLGNGMIGGTLNKMIAIGHDMTRTYRTMNAHGEQFGGSMLDMSIAAANAGLPLGEFADAVVASSFAMKRMGDKDFPGLQKELRESMMEASNFGMTMEGVTKFSANFWETTRRTGVLENISKKQLVKQTVELADVTQTMATQTGKATDAISDLTNQAISDSLAASRIATMTSQQGIAANEKLNKNITVLAAQAGEAGTFLSGLAAESFGMDGFAEFTTQGQTLIAAGMGHLANAFDGIEGMSPEQTAMRMNDFRKGLEQNLPSLRDLAKSTGAGSAEARQLLKVYGEMKDVSIDELRRREKTKDGMTKFFLVIETLWNKVAGGFREGFLKGFKPMFDAMGDITKSKRFDAFAAGVARVGETLGNFLANLLSEKNLTNFGEKLGALFDDLANFDYMGAFKDIAAFFRDIDWKGLGLAIKSLIDFGLQVASMLKPFIAILPLLFVGKMLISPFTSLIGLITGFSSAVSAVTGTLATLAGTGSAAAAAGSGVGAAGAGAGAAAAGIGSKLLKVGGRALGGIGGGLMLYDGVTSVNTEDKSDKAMGYLKSAGGAALMGAAIGSVIPGLGTMVGAAVGGGLGLAAAGISDLLSSDTKAASDSISESQEALQKQAASLDSQRTANNGPDPTLEKLDMMIAQQKITNDLMIGVAQNQTRVSSTQTRLLDKIAKKEV